MVTVRYP